MSLTTYDRLHLRTQLREVLDERSATTLLDALDGSADPTASTETRRALTDLRTDVGKNRTDIVRHLEAIDRTLGRRADNAMLLIMVLAWVPFVVIIVIADHIGGAG